MGTISVSLPSDGQTADAADYNVPINTIVSAINGNLDSNNLAASGVVPNNLFTGTGTSWAWQSWTPTLGATGGGSPAIGNGAFACKYTQIGKTVVCRFKLTVGSTTNLGTGGITFTLPVTGSADYSTNFFAGNAFMFDSSAVADYGGHFCITSTTVFKVEFHSDTVGGGMTQASGSASQPFGWATSDVIAGTLIYEAG